MDSEAEAEVCGWRRAFIKARPCLPVEPVIRIVRDIAGQVVLKDLKSVNTVKPLYKQPAI